MIAVWARFFRVRLLPTAILNALTGAIAAGAAVDPPPPLECALAGLVIVGLYLAGMGMNDLADRERDRVHAPDRPIPSGAIGVRIAGAAVLLAGGIALAAAALLPARTLPWSAAILLAILVYDLAAKDHPWLGPLAMGSVRALVVVFGASLAGAARDGLVAAVVIGGHGFWTTRYSLEEERARPEVLAGRARAVLAHGLASAALVAWIVSPAPLLLAGWGLPIAAIGAALARRGASPPGAFTFRSLSALPLLDAALQLSYNSPLTALACALIPIACLPLPRSRRRPEDPPREPRETTERPP